MDNAKDLMAIIDGCLAGEQQAWAEFYRHFGRVAKGLLYRWGGFSDTEIQDLIQEIMLRLYKGGLAQFKGTTIYEFLAYYKTIILNAARTYGQKRGRPPVNHKSDFRFAGNMPNNADFSDQLEVWDAVRAWLLSLPPQEREIILLKLQGLKNREISQRLKIPQGTVESKYFRLLERLRRTMEPDEC
ncbi:MAG: hypothetical protein BZ151_05165 [Desulfobacca sp. 4484_104]|nr:MAG: hypothetical protein BZ151_05165 [Desulfobacca sp. 4484_104]RLA89416.1 MAG: hypothetical protein DRG58_05200 [Deltaproteobacteria bacterium]